MFAKKSLGPDPRSKSIVEAEKGETVLTNKSRGLNNIVEMYNIGGKKHSAGGTPLDLPINDEGAGASFIFSDKLKITDPAVLEMFGFKKPSTYAAVSKKHVSTINDSKKILIDKDSDDYSMKAAEKNIETSMGVLNKLKVLQESEKGFTNGMPTGTENFFKDMGISPDEMLAPNDEMIQMAQAAEEKAYGGIVKKFFLSKMENGGEPVIVTDKNDPRLIAYNNALKISSAKMLRLKNNEDFEQEELDFSEYDNSDCVNCKRIRNTLDLGAREWRVNGWTDPNEFAYTITPEYKQKMDSLLTQPVIYKEPQKEPQKEEIPGQKMSKGNMSPQYQAFLNKTSNRFEYGGSVNGIRKMNFLPKAEGGIDLSQFGNVDPNAKSQYLYIQDVLGKNENFKKALYDEYLKIQKDKKYYGKGYGSILDKEKDFAKIKLSTPEEVFKYYLEMQGRNLIFKSQGYKIAETANDPSKNKIVPELAKKHGVPLPTKSDEIAKQQIAYWAFDNLAKEQDNYTNLGDVMKPFSSSQFGSSDDKFDGKASSISLADGDYTNTSAGQVSLFRPDKANTIVKQAEPLTFKEEEEGSPAPLINVTGQKDSTATEKVMLENPIGYSSQDINNYNRAFASRTGIRRYNPFAISPEMAGIDSAYYSPDRAIASVMEQVNSAEDTSKAFGDAQGATAGALGLSGEAFNKIADIVGNYADKNVGLFNNVAKANSERASKQNAMDANVRTQLFSDNVDMAEKFRRGVEVAKDKLTMIGNAADKRRSDLYNVNRLNEQSKIDPYSGFLYITNEKDLKGKSQSDISAMGDEFNSFRNTLPKDINNDLALKMFMGFKTGKIVTDDVTKDMTPSEVQ